MKRSLFPIGALGLGFLIASFNGCNKSETGGGAGDETFKLVAPATSTDVKQGEVQTVRLSLDRGAGFKQGVKLETKSPTGLQIDPANTSIGASDKPDVQMTVTAAKDAPLGEQKVMVKATPDKGEAVNVEFKVTVSAK